MLIKRLGLRYFIIFLSIVFLIGCASRQPISKQNENAAVLYDLRHFPQDPLAYDVAEDEGYIGEIESFAKDYFRVWNLERIETQKEKAMWAFNSFDANNSFGMTLQPLESTFFEQQLQNSNFTAYGTVKKNAITLKTLNLRAMPTDEPVFLDPKKAGEGYPFDYMQNSLITANKPLFVSHYSLDKKWVFVTCSFGFGWLKSTDIAYIEKRYTDVWQWAKQIFLLKDGIPITDTKGDYLFSSRVGMVLPLIDEDDENYYVLTISAERSNKPYYNRSAVSKKIATLHPLEFTKENITSILTQLQKSKYGWGGMYEQRDCSSTIRDFFIPFGVWMPRNSSVQSKVGEVVSLDAMGNEEKLQIVKQRAKPFRTLLYKLGHIVLYAGVYDDQPVIFQNVWGVKTKKGKKEGRYIVGRPVFSTLELGKELKDYDPTASMLTNLKSMNTLP